MNERLEEIKELYQWTSDNGLVPRLHDSEIEWLIEQAEKVEQYERSFSDYTGTLNETRRKRDEVKNKLAVALKTIKQQKNLIRELEGSVGWHINAVKRYEKAISKAILQIDLVHIDESDADTALEYIFRDLKQVLE